MLDGKTMTNALIGKNGSGQIADDLMHLDQDAPGLLRVKSEWRHSRVNLTPLLGPVSADLVGAADKIALERSRPSHVRRHEAKRGVMRRSAASMSRALKAV